MTTSATSVGIYFESDDLGDLDGVTIDEIARGGPDEPSHARGRDDIALGKDGRAWRNRRKDVRSIELRGWVFGTTIADYWDNRVALGSLMDTTERGTLSATLRNGDVYTIEALPISVDYAFESFMQAKVSIVLEAITPDWTEVEGS